MLRISTLRLSQSALAIGLAVAALAGPLQTLAAPNYPITGSQRAKAQQVANAGVPLSELSPNAPDSYTVKRGDTLWDISKLFLKSPWRWPELWGMNLQEIRNPHLIYPGQILYLDKSNGYARLRMGQPSGNNKLSPRIRESDNLGLAISGIPMSMIQPFLTEGIVLETNELDKAPRIVAAPDSRVMLARGDIAYVRGDVSGASDWRLFRQAKPLVDPTTKEVLGYEAEYVGTAEYIRPGQERDGSDGAKEIIPSTFELTSIRQEAQIGDRLAPVPDRDFGSFAPHAPAQDVNAVVVSLYGTGVASNAAQAQVVAINKGAQDGMERGHVLDIMQAGRMDVDKTDGSKTDIRLPDEENGALYIFRVFNRVSYGLILSSKRPVRVGDHAIKPR